MYKVSQDARHATTLENYAVMEAVKYPIPFSPPSYSWQSHCPGEVSERSYQLSNPFLKSGLQLHHVSFRSFKLWRIEASFVPSAPSAATNAFHVGAKEGGPGEVGTVRAATVPDESARRKTILLLFWFCFVFGHSLFRRGILTGRL